MEDVLCVLQNAIYLVIVVYAIVSFSVFIVQTFSSFLKKEGGALNDKKKDN